MAQDNGKQNIGQALPTFALISYRAVFPMFHNATHPVGWHCRLRRYCPPMNHGLWVLPPSFLRNLLVPGDFVSCHRKWMVSLWAAELIQLLGPGLGDFFSKNRVNISFKLGKYLPARNYRSEAHPKRDDFGSPSRRPGMEPGPTFSSNYFLFMETRGN
jgi:hypothetical protein